MTAREDFSDDEWFQQFRRQPGSTDVLAFPLDDEPVDSGRSPDSGGPGPGASPPEVADMPLLLGDVVICPAVADRNAPQHAGTRPLQPRE